MADLYWPFREIVIDTVVLVEAFSPQASEKKEIALAHVDASERGDIVLYCSATTIVEMPKVVEPPWTLERLAVMHQVLDRSAIRVLPLTQQIAQLGLDVGLQHNIKNWADCAILATAQTRGLDLLTWDGNDFEIGRQYGPVTVLNPKMPGGQESML